MSKRHGTLDLVALDVEGDWNIPLLENAAAMSGASLGSSLRQRDVDLLIQTSGSCSEVGSLLRSAWAFGWRRVFLSDARGMWFSEDRAVVSQGRAAARREVNPLAILPVGQLKAEQYRQALWCTPRSGGTPLSRVRLPPGGPLLVCFAADESLIPANLPVEPVYVDHRHADVEPCFRHAGSILLSVLSQLLRGGSSG